MEIKLTETDLNTLKTIAYIVDIEEGGKLSHSWRTAVIAKCLAAEKCKESELSMYIAGLLHDVGTFDLSNRLIHHQDHMENAEVAAVRVHPQKGAAIVASLDDFIPIAKNILDHHEWINGEGYPRGLKQNEISLESQILKIADKVAFLVDTETVTEIIDLPGALKDRIGREFSQDLYDCLLAQLEKNDIWKSIIDQEKLSELTKKIFTHLKVEKDQDVAYSKNMFLFFGRILDAKHSYTEGHSRRVSYFSVLIALALNLPDQKVKRIESAAFLHDIGKVGIPKSILDKKGRLTNEEYQIIKKHSFFSHEIVKGISTLENLANIVGADQEHWDGSGYPNGIKMEEIPLEARIIFIADAFDAMTSNRSYHKAVSVPEAMNELKRCAGKDFDSNIVNIACKLFDGFENSAVLAYYVDDGKNK